ncbi:MAG: SGNH/GDSL hydrolase family protein [Anaerolineae bacterium]|nr:SGNH/GDSL hydrolase family protein [Anaerolineae bacterium]
MWRYLALGDSYTIGESTSPAERFPAQLAEQLRAQGMEPGVPEIVARTGWTTEELALAIQAADPKGTYDLVTLLIGVNNQYRGRSAEQYRSEFVGLLERAIAFAGNRPKRVIVISIPDWGMTPFGSGRQNTSAEIDTFNAVNLQAAEQFGAVYADITPISRAAARDAALVAPDGLHPSGKMYARWVELLMPLAKRALQDDS